MTNWPDLYRSDNLPPDHARFERRVLAVSQPIPYVSNIHEVRLDCGHEPLLMGGEDPQVGKMCFCPTCYDLRE